MVIAHRLSTVRKAHRLVLMSDGKVLNVGTWEELAERQRLFKSMTGERG